jgi:hypothetical protein
VAEAAKKAADKAAEQAASEVKGKAQHQEWLRSSIPEDVLKFTSSYDDGTLEGYLANKTLYHIQIVAMQHVAWVEVATSGGRCSSLKANSKGIREVLLSGGVYDQQAVERSHLRAEYAEYYQHNPAIFCNFAREQFGPNGKKRDEFRSNGTPMIDVVEAVVAPSSTASPSGPSAFPEISAEQRELFKRGMGQTGRR